MCYSRNKQSYIDDIKMNGQGIRARNDCNHKYYDKKLKIQYILKK